MSIPKLTLRRAIIALALILNFAFIANLLDDLRPWPGTAGSENLKSKGWHLEAEYHWRMNHRDYFYLVTNAPSADAAANALAEEMAHYGYRKPHWWEFSRWMEYGSSGVTDMADALTRQRGHP